MIANRDREQIDELKAAFARSASVVELPSDGSLAAARLAVQRIDLVLLKLTTDPANRATLAALQGAGLCCFNSLHSVDLCQSRRATFEFVRRQLPALTVPRAFETPSAASRAIADGTIVWVRRDAHNIPLGERVLGVARTPAALAALVDDLDADTLFFQEYLEHAGDTYKAFVVGDDVVVGVRCETGGRTSFAQTAMPARVVDEIRAIGRGFEMAVYGVDFFCRGSDAVFLDFNDFPSFRGVAGASERIAAFAAATYF